MFGPKPHTAYHRKDLKEPVKKLIVFPVTNFSGLQDANSKKVEATFVGKWGELYGKNNVVPGGPAIFKMMESMGKDTYGQFISSLDNTSIIFKANSLLHSWYPLQLQLTAPQRQAGKSTMTIHSKPICLTSYIFSIIHHRKFAP